LQLHNLDPLYLYYSCDQLLKLHLFTQCYIDISSYINKIKTNIFAHIFTYFYITPTNQNSVAG